MTSDPEAKKIFGYGRGSNLEPCEREADALTIEPSELACQTNRNHEC